MHRNQLPTFAANSKRKPMNTMNIKDEIRKACKGMNVGNFQESFKSIAETLFNHFCIQSGDKEFYFAEIEFYYYDDANQFNQGWNEVTYERNGYEAGDLFYHLSGMDICFDSNLSKDKSKKVGYGGGILIRSIVEENEQITVGPLTCVNKILNACKGDKMPQLVPTKQRNCNPIETYRYLGKNDFDAIQKKKNKDGELKLAYYDPLSPEAWNRARSSYYNKRLTANDSK